jgi:hypothetical protein
VTAADGTLWQTPMNSNLWTPDSNRWAKLTFVGGKLANAGELAVLGNGRLAVADGNAVVLFDIKGDTATQVARLTAWGEQPDAHFGDELHLASDGKRLLVSDTARHRVLLFDAGAFTKPLATFGVTDTPGDDRNHLNTPGTVSFCGNRAVVADLANQRVVKLVIRD